MAIDASSVKELRNLTGAGVLDCKKALEKSDGDFAKASELLRGKGPCESGKERLTWYTGG